MSPRNDTNLSLCLAQADLSPLHYRHGAIIVRGGKVIGQGFNTYRPGFDGGALKSGVLPSASLDGPSIAELKQRLKAKPKSKSNKPDEGSFTPFEATGCGHNANIALSMHSEMMAIQSALSLSSGTQSSQTSARSAKCFQKPCFKLPGDSKKRKARARGLKAYAKAVCEEAAGTGNSVKVRQEHGNEDNVMEEDNGFQNKKLNKNESANTWKSAAKQRMKKRPYLYQNGHQYEGTYHHKSQQHHYAHKRGLEPQSTISKGSSIADSQPPSTEDDFIRSNKPKAKSPKKASIPTKPQQILVTKNKSSGKATTAERTKDLRLKGSDLYVARLGTKHSTPQKSKSNRSEDPDLSPPPPIPPKLPPTSLHDELSPSSRSASPSSRKIEPEPSPQPEIRASRPCYRCVSAMHSVGIKRVFWTTHTGEWEMAKVRDLVDALEIGMDGDGNGDGESLGTGQESKGVFVTKHEVLMLKRAMGF
ncbi:hypothetical protein VTL71DRAFT_1569 [Oculimacula yallundae]|uniref:CMP/dCMP-type deaminase domain-containing protein n=1 Tax=Oculimacula yallundae TaxID=86028 RepID=A0ABR4CB38_9HELO